MKRGYSAEEEKIEGMIEMEIEIRNKRIEYDRKGG